ncbi:MAG: hypothetical protein ACT4P0_06025 [Panacagrimonas sp.]
MKQTVPLLALMSLTLAACGGGGGGGGGGVSTPPATAAVVAARAPDFSSGAVSLVDLTAPFAAQNNLPPNDTSDIFVRSGGDHYFVVQRFGSDKILRFSVADPDTPEYTYSTQDAGDSADSNPSDLVILSPTKAYLLRYGSGKLWIVNPSATREQDFKTGEIDLSAYDSDGVPEMTAGLIKDGLLYVLMQRLDNFAANRDGFLAVIDTVTDQEIDTDDKIGNLDGLRLPVRNPSSLVANPANDDLLVLAVGGYDSSFNPVYDGGILRVDTVALTVQKLVDDGTVGAAPYGQFTDLAVTDLHRAYFIGSEGFFGAQDLYRFDPTSTAAPQPVAAAQGIKMGALAYDGEGRLWIGRTETAAPGLTVLDVSVASEAVVEDLIDTVQTPINIDFVTAPTP